MIGIRKSKDRGHANFGWLDAYHSFSFGDYYDPQFTEFGNLRVLNEDKVSAQSGFPLHGHQNMEILTYIISGTLEHQDTLGNKEQIQPGEVQRMSAGRGIRHSEYNPTNDKTTHLFQIWFTPLENGIQPSYEQKSFSKELEKHPLVLVASQSKKENSVYIHQDIEVFISRWRQPLSIEKKLVDHKMGWLQLAAGELEINGIKIQTGDAAYFKDLDHLQLNSTSPVEFVLILQK